jgi:sugar/nucleoside kinase (ribokinase family)
MSTPRFDVTIAGELNLDLILYGLPAQLIPEREVLADRMVITLGGSSAIVAHNLAAIGSRVGFQSVIGDDAFGQIALQRLAEENVETSRVRKAGGTTKSGVSVILQRGGERNILTYPGTIAELKVSDLDFAYLSDARHFHLSSFYLQTALQPQVPELFQKLKAAGLTISLDTNDDPDDRWQGGLLDALPYVDVFFPNAREVRRIARTDDLQEAVRRLAERVPLLVVKLGREGAIARRGTERYTSPAAHVTPVDAVGAGDSFNAGFLHQYVRGADVPECLRYGNLAGAFSTTAPGGTEAFRDRELREQFFGEENLRAHVQR